MNLNPHPSSWRSHHFRAMGTEMAFWLETDDQAAAQPAFAEAEALFRHNEQVLSRFQADSELSQINSRAGQWTAVSDLLWDVLVVALEMAERTNGRFDPTILNKLEQAGYTQSFEQMLTYTPLPNPPDYPVALGNWQDVVLDEADRSVYLPRGLRLDLGGIAKGYTAQQAVALLAQCGPCLVDAGGDISAGSPPVGYDGWPVAVTTPRTSPIQVDLFTLPLAHASLATSGIDHRRWQQNGRSHHHLIDPITGQPADTDLLTATVWAETAVVAEAWATATIIQGAAAGLAALQTHHMPATLVTQSEELLLTPAMATYAGVAYA
ncbi:MAG: FAD:protein FMN transferase [Anaerolineae bacterium]|nr:FAD:protein FMN transferase [Anaerolineae bacterium]